MKQSLFFSFLLFSTQAFSQVTPRFQFGLTLTPQLSPDFYYGDGIFPNGSEEILPVEKEPQIDYGGFLFSRYNLNERAAIQLGMGYRNTGNRSKKTKAEWLMSSPDLKVSWVIHSIIIPLQFNYRLSTKKIRPIVSTGLTASCITGSKTKIKKWYNHDATIKTKREAYLGHYNLANLGANLGFGVEISLGSRMNLSVQPTYEVNLLKVRSDNASLNSHFYALGLQTGIAF